MPAVNNLAVGKCAVKSGSVVEKSTDKSGCGVEKIDLKELKLWGLCWRNL